MCRQNQLWGGMLLTLGIGILVGLWLSGGFLAHCLGFGLIAIGCGTLRRK